MIRKDDTVMIISGKDKGKTGKVLHIYPEKNRALVEKMNIVKRHTRPNQQMRQGGIVEKEASIHISNLMIYCAKCSKRTRVRYKQDKKGKVRLCCRCGEIIGA